MYLGAISLTTSNISWNQNRPAGIQVGGALACRSSGNALPRTGLIIAPGLHIPWRDPYFAHPFALARCGELTGRGSPPNGGNRKEHAHDGAEFDRV